MAAPLTPAVGDDLAARNTFLAVFFYADQRRWDDARACLAPTLDVDYTSLAGGEPEVLPADELLSRWRGLLPGFDATHHLLSVVTSTPDPLGDIHLVANGTATHRLGEDLWVAGGHYEATLRRHGGGWLLSSLRFVCTWQSGDPALPAAATRRVAGGPG